MAHLWTTTDSTSNLWPDGAADQAKIELRKMSDSMISPVVSSIVQLVEPSVRSRSGRGRNPMTEVPSSSIGSEFVNPRNCDVMGTWAGVPQVANAWPMVVCSCAAVTPVMLRSVTAYLIGWCAHLRATTSLPTWTPYFR
jgi:hypothetical protein